MHYVRDALGSVVGRLGTVVTLTLACCRSSEDVLRTARVQAAEEQRHTTTIMRWRRREVRQCYLPLHFFSPPPGGACEVAPRGTIQVQSGGGVGRGHLEDVG